MKKTTILLLGLSLIGQSASAAVTGSWAGFRASDHSAPCRVVIEHEAEVGPSLMVSFDVKESERKTAPEADLGIVQLTNVSLAQLEQIVQGPGIVSDLSVEGTVFRYRYKVRAIDQGGGYKRRGVTIQQNSRNGEAVRSGMATIVFENGRPTQAQIIKRGSGILGSPREVFSQRCLFNN